MIEGVIGIHTYGLSTMKSFLNSLIYDDFTTCLGNLNESRYPVHL